MLTAAILVALLTMGAIIFLVAYVLKIAKCVP